MSFRRTRAMSGISTLIIFIAMILVAAIAAVVLLQTVGSLQSQAVATGKESAKQVSTQLRILSVAGEINTDTNRTVKELRMTVQLGPGSAPIRLSDLFLTIKDSNGDIFKAGIDYNQPATNSDNDVNAATGIDTLAGGSAGTKYAVKWLTTAPSQRTTLNQGDLIEIWYATNRLVSINETVRIELNPQGEAGAHLEIKMPVSFTKTYEQFFP